MGTGSDQTYLEFNFLTEKGSLQTECLQDNKLTSIFKDAKVSMNEVLWPYLPFHLSRKAETSL
jgi:hypothetical protein